MSWLLAGGVGCAVVVGVGKVVKDMFTYAREMDRPKARWEDEPPL